MKSLPLLMLGLACLLPLPATAGNSQTLVSPAALPAADTRPKVFLAGSIEMGKAGDWQRQVQQALADEGVLMLNPRRADWNPAWRAEADEPEFRRQVEWELAALEQADIVLMYFAPGTQSPITLLEFGLYARSGKLLVAAPAGFWRKGNLDITGDRYGVPRYDDLPALIAAVKQRLAAQRAR
ncbi:nucleoside 2-deoxyribosyltransferase domain-containing protein [Stenotrophomonas sp. MMGLT7]|uniref:nucleoside 2-deoxyribosyltransferase domain-containing protein n=1 Tax=Stenotrophomonas sp. MMGLT7 TaxID=2901227 RepID=UPI001E440B45|nr:nucleoside 2-deoxyribosyltransferase domain-containing protein [Stenotrophomonas sp. MMGLT7]MCD7098456.1 nucleoside 2-deoxyribosyltransferase domain-containing protein [Stenotrophomonas sp. MMGLT7]